MTRTSLRWVLFGVGVVLLLLWLPGSRVLAQSPDCPDCPVSLGVPSILAPGSPQADSIQSLFYFIMILAGMVFVIVESLLVFTVLRFRNRPPESAVQMHGNTRLEIAWTAAPAVILMVLLGFTLRTMATVRTEAAGQPLQVQVIGHQWWWEFRYPDLGIVTANELVVPMGQEVRLQIESVDVIHSFWIPELHGKQDAIPGHMTHLSFTPMTTGVYGGQCAEFCGDQHANMRMAVVAKEPADFQAWAAAQQQPPDAEPDGDPAKGQQAFMTGPCVACHTIDGTAAQGKIGPNLTHLMSRDFIAGGVLQNTPENLALWLQDTQKIKPGNNMVIGPLDEQTIRDLVTYLTSLK